jgi:hypothetical protein
MIREEEDRKWVPGKKREKLLWKRYETRERETDNSSQETETPEKKWILFLAIMSVLFSDFVSRIQAKRYEETEWSIAGNRCSWDELLLFFSSSYSVSKWVFFTSTEISSSVLLHPKVIQQWIWKTSSQIPMKHLIFTAWDENLCFESRVESRFHSQEEKVIHFLWIL